jgi:hypothetical protein
VCHHHSWRGSGGRYTSRSSPQAHCSFMICNVVRVITVTGRAYSTWDRKL